MRTHRLRPKPSKQGFRPDSNVRVSPLASGRLYIANYKFNNILEALLEPATGDLRIERAIGAETTLSPENTAVSEGLGLVAAANYDGSSVQAFRLSDGKLVWTHELSGAHGVASLPDGRILATGFTLPPSPYRYP